MSDYWENEKKDWNMTKKSYQNDFELKETVEQVLTEYKSLAWPERKIRQDIMQEFGVKVSLKGTPDKATHKIFFPYKIDGKVVGYKVKDLTKQKKEKGHFYTIGHVGVDCELFGQDHCAGPYNNLRIVEGECLTEDTEIFTNNGWKKFPDLCETDNVLQLDGDLKGSFVKPIRYIEKDYNGKLIAFDNRNYHSLVTENHRMVCYDYKGNLTKQKAKELKYTSTIPKAVIIDNIGVKLSNDQIALLLS